ncbi:MAG: hypothetical protein DWH97_03450 [Planctomycetota bacterium]|nr:MAG: hypothetical protein DWH97_03450 [Planctomycetota bacterium]RLS94078.1 MAG: hypothetical protein DWI12_07275 [Planctomycetota bacterium]
MKIVWTIVALLLLGGLIVLMQPTHESASTLSQDAMIDDALGGDSLVQDTTSPANTQDSAAKPSTNADHATATTATIDVAPAIETAPEPVTPVVAIAEPTAVAIDTTTPAASTSDNTIEATSNTPGEFTPVIPEIAQAQVIPSKFVRLADGSISIDDAWTITGEGSKETPYEITWEFLSSAQETYMPRLAEKKLPARIAFLSGKHVRISGYLAFPLIAPTASECLVMLNQWDGCCIGVPPTPYDAVEVKLGISMKGWKKHTLNFGAVSGVFRVEPYLVENWLVGLYMLEGATVDREL